MVITMPISKVDVSNDNSQKNTKRVSNSPRPSGVAGKPISYRPSSIDDRSAVPDASFTTGDEMGYGRIVKVVEAVKK